MLNGEEVDLATTENCSICHEPVLMIDSISLHKKVKEYEHRFHLDCLRPHLQNNRYPECPLCRGQIDQEIILHYKQIPNTLAACIMKNESSLSEEQIKQYVSERDFNLNSFQEHFEKHVKPENFDIEKLKLVLKNLPLKLDKAEWEKSLTSFKILAHAHSLASFEDFIPANDLKWTANLIQMVFLSFSDKIQQHWAENRRRMICSVCSFMKQRKFVSEDLWALASENVQDPVILKALLPHVLPSCFATSIVVIERALVEEHLDLVRNLLAISKKHAMNSIRLLLDDPETYFTDVATVEFLIEHGIHPHDLFNHLLVMENHRRVIFCLLKHQLWPLNHFVDYDGIRYKYLKESLRDYCSLKSLCSVIELCLVLFGALFNPEKCEWIFSQYKEETLTPKIFNQNIDLISDERICGFVSTILENLIHGSWNSLSRLESNLLPESAFLTRIYEYDICKKIPFLSSIDLRTAENDQKGLLRLLGILEIPLRVEIDVNLKSLIEKRDKDGLTSYLNQNQLNYAEREQAIITASSIGSRDMVLMLMGHDPEVFNRKSEEKSLGEEDGAPTVKKTKISKD